MSPHGGSTAARTPEDLDRLFAEGMAAGDVDAVVALYEPGGVLVSAEGVPTTGPAAIRTTLARLAAMRPQIAMGTRSPWPGRRSRCRAGSRTAAGCSRWTTRSRGGRASAGLQRRRAAPFPDAIVSRSRRSRGMCLGFAMLVRLANASDQPPATAQHWREAPRTTPRLPVGCIALLGGTPRLARTPSL